MCKIYLLSVDKYKLSVMSKYIRNVSRNPVKKVNLARERFMYLQSVPNLPKMAKKNADKKSDWQKSQEFGDYIERVVGEINIKLISIVNTSNQHLNVRRVLAGVGEEEIRGRGGESKRPLLRLLLRYYQLLRQSVVLRKLRLGR